jgi:pentose-5-phosphate-3-epimerase
MTVNPGWGGQAFIERSIEKIARVRTVVGDDVALEVDGGIEPDTAARCRRAGADLFVAWMFTHAVHSQVLRAEVGYAGATALLALALAMLYRRGTAARIAGP